MVAESVESDASLPPPASRKSRAGQSVPDPYYTVHRCTICGASVAGLHGRWACGICGECSPYAEPPGGWRADPNYDQR